MPGEARRRAILNTGLGVVSILGEGAAGVSRLPVSVPRIQVGECTTGVLASRAVIRNLVGRGQHNEAGALSLAARAPVVGSMGAPGNVRRRAQPELQARTCGGIHGRGRGRKRPTQ